jgi:meiotic recombination protein SPO11
LRHETPNLPSNTPPPKHATSLQLEEDFIQSNPDWVHELELMLKTKEKAEIQALSSFGFQYLSQVYLPLKLQEGDWI